jgi:hypothetical protein
MHPRFAEACGHPMTLRGALIGVLFIATACATLRPVTPSELRGADPPRRVRVTLADHSIVVLTAPKVSSDTLVGAIVGENQADGFPVREALLLSQVTAIDALDPGPFHLTPGLAWGGVSLAFALLVIETTKSPPPPPVCHDFCTIRLP